MKLSPPSMLGISGEVNLHHSSFGNVIHPTNALLQNKGGGSKDKAQRVFTMILTLTHQKGDECFDER